MYGSKRNAQASLGYTVLMILLIISFTGCTSTTLHWITPVPSPDAPPMSQDSAVAAPEQETPSPSTVAATDEPTSEATEEAGAEDSEADDEEDNEVDDEQEIAGDEVGPTEITHALARRETCSECHAVDSRKDPAPADHIGMTDDLCLYCHMPEEGEAAVPPLPEEAATAFCLGCHGPHEELLASTADYATEDGLAGNPHMFIPHDKTDIASCGLCHAVHPLPVTDEVEIEQTDIDYCFAACHHEDDFTPCSECH